VPKTQRRIKGNPRKRSLNALAIASSTDPNDLKVRQHRLGELEGRSKAGSHTAKNRGGGHGPNSGRPPDSPEKAQFGLDIDNGSDSEGNTWRLGQVGSDQDSDIDSNNAMGESDEERFEGFAFRGSRKLKCRQKQNMVQLRGEAGGIDLQEPEESSDGESEGTDNSLGEGAIDLAAMLDASAEDEQTSERRKTSSRELEIDAHSQGATEYASSDGEEDESVLSISEDEGGPDPAKLSALRNLISSLESSAQEPPAKRQRVSEANESRVPSEFSLGSFQKLTVEDLLPSVANHSLKKSLRIIAANGHPKGSSPRTSIPSKLEVPLARRQQDRLDRNAAYEKSKETLNRWVDTVKHMRRAEHLSFPLPGPSGEATSGTRRLPPTTGLEPLNELESTIQTILQDSGLVTSNGKADEGTILSFEELQTSKMPLAEVEKRRAQLRMTRELLFREEVRAKRVKKIKSKSYRRVHRKQREKAEKGVREALALAGINTSDGDECDGRRRAEERMGARHRESKWAKAVKGSGRGAWDVDTRAGVVEMARRGEELRRRIGGKQVRNTADDLELGYDTSDSDARSGDSGEEGSDGEKEGKKLLRELQEVGGSLHSSDPGLRSTSKLFSLKFMQKAEAARRAENDAAASKLQRELAGDGHSSDEGQTTITLVGRKKYGLTRSMKGIRAKSGSSNESGGESCLDGDTTGAKPDVVTDMGWPSEMKHLEKQAEDPRTGPGNRDSEPIVNLKASANPWLDQGEMMPQRPRRRRKENGGRKQSADSKVNSEIKASRAMASSIDDTFDDVVIDPSLALSAPRSIQLPKKPTATNSKVSRSTDEWKSANVAPGMGRNDLEDDKLNMLVSIRDQELMKRAFAGDDVVGEFEKEKRKTIHDEGGKVIDNTLPGWGNWTGAGVSRKEEKRNRGKVISKLEGITEGKRRDAKLDRVIVNEKRAKKVHQGVPFYICIPADSSIYRMSSILPPTYLILSRLGSNMKDRYGYLLVQNGRPKRLSKTPRSLGL
jgi:U3 small nucleolar RNA-associated protein 14